MCKSAISQKKIFVTGSGQQKRAWCYISDLVDGVSLIIKKRSVKNCFNIGNPTNYYSLSTVAKKIQLFNPNSKVVFATKTGVDIIERSRNIDHAQKTLGFYPKVSLHEGLKLTYRWAFTQAQKLRNNEP